MAKIELFGFGHITHFHVWSSIVVTILILFIYMPILFYNLYQYCKKRKHFVFKRRYANITIIEVSLQLSKFMFTWLAYLFIWANKPIFALLFYSIGHISCWILYWHLVFRFWMLHYDVMFTMISLNNSWKELISQTEKFEQNWYIIRKKTLGNYKYVQWKIIWPAIILSLILSYFSLFLIIEFGQLNASAMHLKLSVDSLFYLLPAIILGTIYYKTPSFNDMIYIKPELKYIWISFVSGIIIYSFVWSYFAFFNPSDYIYDIILFIQITAGSTVQFIGGMATTWWVNRKLTPLIESNMYILKRHRIPSKKKKQLKFVESISLLSDHSSDDDDDNNDNIHDMNKMNRNQINLTEIFIQSKALEIFSIHLANELSLENLICIIECLQFQAFVHEFMTKNDNKVRDKNEMSLTSSRLSNPEKMLLYEEIVFADIVPLSSIVFGADDYVIPMLTDVEFLLQAKERCYSLYEKYMTNESEMEVNISSQVKKELHSIMNNYNEFVFSANYGLAVLLHIFDGTVLELFQLMNDSLQRFTLSYEFEKLKQLYLVNY